MPSDSSASIDGTQSPADRECDADSEVDSVALLGPDTDPDTEPIEWGPVRFERLRSLAFGASVTVGVLVLATLLFVAAGVGLSLLGGGGPPASMWVVLVILLVGGPMSLLYWLVAYDLTSRSDAESCGRSSATTRSTPRNSVSAGPSPGLEPCSRASRRRSVPVRSRPRYRCSRGSPRCSSGSPRSSR